MEERSRPAGAAARPGKALTSRHLFLNDSNVQLTRKIVRLVRRVKRI
jgi:hypothetical protein